MCDREGGREERERESEMKRGTSNTNTAADGVHEAGKRARDSTGVAIQCVCLPPTTRKKCRKLFKSVE